jgi:Ca-activated chloride channel family protein
MMHQRSVLLALFIMTGTLAATAQGPTFRIAAEEVRIDVLVTDHGKPLGNLKAADFEVFDNGVKQTIQYTTLQKQLPIRATLVFDMSGSVAGQLLNDLKDAAHGFLSDLQKDDQVALITFNHAVTLGTPLTNDLKSVKLALDRTKPEGNSSLIDASYAGLVIAESKFGPPLLIIFSDGLDTYSWLTNTAVLESAKHKDAVVYSISTNLLPPKSFLSDIAESTGGALFVIGSSQDLSTVFLKILDEFRQRYLVTYTPQGVSESGWHNLEVRVKHRSAKVNARPGYMRSPSQK